jgi:N-acetyl-alpha-D-muramate 1-phosphate uridylyltransferase
MSGAPAAIDVAMVLAAGLGKRMRPLTATTPKPLIVVGGRALLDHALDRVEEAGIGTAIVNVHYLADLVEAHLRRRRSPEMIVSDERERLLETGGGLKKVLPLVAGEAVLSLNSDSFWIEGPHSNLRRLMEAWDPEAMDVLLLLAPTATSLGYEGSGDFAMDADGRLRRRGERELTPFVYTGVALLKTALFTDTPDGPFSLNLVFDRAIEAGRLHGLRLDGEWLHVGTPEAVRAAEERLLTSVR